jgi:hypothetical protein
MIRLSVLISLVFASIVTSFPQYGSLAGLSEAELAAIIPTLKARDVEPPPPPLAFNGTQLSNNPEHPFEPLQPGDIRGPCPGLNTLASHGYIPRNGVATPTQIINAVQEGFNMGNDLATFVTFAAFLVNGNPITNLMSIGGATSLTGPNPPPPATVGGLDTHNVFEGDTSMTRADIFFGDNHSFNETLFDEFEKFSNEFGAGEYNLTVAGELRHQRILDSIATNPQFTFLSPRFFTAFSEAVFPTVFFVDGRANNFSLPLANARRFFQDMHMPDDFFRANQPFGLNQIGPRAMMVLNAHPIQPGSNQGTVNSFVPDPASPNLTDFCGTYTNWANVTVRALYPNPTGALLEALNGNLNNFFIPAGQQGCTQVFPYGKST